VGTSVAGAVFGQRVGRFGQREHWAAPRLNWFHWEVLSPRRSSRGLAAARWGLGCASTTEEGGSSGQSRKRRPKAQTSSPGVTALGLQTQLGTGAASLATAS